VSNIIAFEHIEKCAGTSVIQALREVYGENHFDLIPKDKSAMFASPSDIVRAAKLNPRLKSIAGHSIRGGINCLDTDGLSMKYYTILRDPVKRMWSDYKYSRNVLGFKGDIKSFVAETGRRNFLAKSLCGEEDYLAAIENLETRYEMFGVVENFSAFVEGLSLLTGFDLSGYKTKKANAAIKTEDHEFGKCQAFIKSENAVDIKIYEYAVKLCGEKGYFYKGNSESKIQLTSLKHSSKIAYFKNLMFRNLVYKPYMGYLPFKNHALPLYRSMKSSLEK